MRLIPIDSYCQLSGMWPKCHRPIMSKGRSFKGFPSALSPQRRFEPRAINHALSPRAALHSAVPGSSSATHQRVHADPRCSPDGAKSSSGGCLRLYIGMALRRSGCGARNALVGLAAKSSFNVTPMQIAQAIAGAYRSVSRAKAAESGQRLLKFVRGAGKMPAAVTLPRRLRGWPRSHRRR